MTGSFAFLIAPVGSVLDTLFDNTFAGIHRFDWFDWALLIPYFATLIILSVYGLHRYEVIREYIKVKKRLPTEPPKKFDQLPPVTIQLPLYNERYVVERLIEGISKIDYPRELLQVQVLDDSTDETHIFTERLVNEYRANGFPIEYHHRTNRHGFKAGALQEGLKTATGEFVAIFDADFVPPRDFLMQTVHWFAEPEVGVVQTRWSYLNRHYNLLTEVQAMLLDGHFVLEHTARMGGKLFFNFNGTAGVLRRSMIDDAGGWQHDTLTEDSDLSYRAQLKGWRFVYLPWVECPSELPVDTYGFQVQQSRWAKGLTQVAKKIIPAVLKAKLPWRVKVEAWMHLTPNISYPMMLIVTGLMLPVMIVRFYMGLFQMVLVDLPLIIASFWSVSIFYITAYRELHGRDWKRSLAFLPALMAAGIGLTLINARAVLEALFGIQTAFARTPKYAIGSQNTKVQEAHYRSRSGWLPYAEIAIGTYFVAMIAFAIDTFNFFAIPFLVLFVAGYYWAGFSTLYQEWQGKLAFDRARRVARVAEAD